VNFGWPAKKKGQPGAPKLSQPSRLEGHVTSLENKASLLRGYCKIVISREFDEHVRGAPLPAESLDWRNKSVRG